ncbi:uncharacterized protein AMSG_01996 [Thecamonas trahens ATCC 50062]|uniref:Endonuclease/exonuclease/phosphatase domain-containing protein n=1 Tax=Thecamonas trahens ATCC 50062 TaxID=461836 RepID=A0A0L0DWR8_THETB|nr:hypothetical protein AMSG_01996 [Thecamonas trahens ATCC 50062]KNC55983.1 hypothetical protein AMSG_01996 [Thecamonas trahens ATCC 50062]|eukprot:XP_013761029.1 hypothetical protein AMSG_01996 [Thecamonas trahens ATCC 50062]
MPGYARHAGGLSLIPGDDGYARVIDEAYWALLRLGRQGMCLDPLKHVLVNASDVAIHMLRHSTDGRSQRIIQVVDAAYRPRHWAVFFGYAFDLSLSISHPHQDELFRHSLRLTTDVYRSPLSLTHHTFAPLHPTPSSSSSSSSRKPSFKLVSYNIWNTNRWNDRAHALAALLARSQPDVIALQEVRLDTSLRDAPEFAFDPDSILARHDLRGLDAVNQVVQLALLLPDYPHFTFQPAMSYPQLPLGRVEEGLLFFSKTPLTDTAYALLSRDVAQDHMDVHQRIVLSTSTRTASGVDVQLLQTHMSLTPTARLRNMLEIASFARATQGRRSKLQLLMGDFNTDVANERTGWGQSIEFIVGRRRIASRHTPARFRDAWYDAAAAQAPRRRHGYGPTFPAHNATLRIDLVFYRNVRPSPAALCPVDVDILGADHYAVAPHDDPDPVLVSDHLGLAASFAPCPPI